MAWACINGVSLQLDTWTMVLNVEMTLWRNWRRINDAFREKDDALMMFLAGKTVMSSKFKTSCNPRHWSRRISALDTSYK